MSVAVDPSITTLITDAFRHTGIPNPTTAQITEMTNGGLQTIKAALWAACTADRLLETRVMVTLPLGSGQIATPSDFDHEVTLDVYGCATNMAFTAASAISSTLTVPSTFSGDVSSMRGLYLFTTSGTGSGQYRQITDYNDSTKVFSITPNWTVTPDSTTAAFVGHIKRRLEMDDPDGRSSTIMYPNQGYPMRYRVVGISPLTSVTPSIEISPVPDTANYALVLTYGPNLTRLDEAGATLIKHIRERRSLWMAGMEYMVANRYDEARISIKRPIWEEQLALYRAHNPVYTRLEGQR